MSDSDILVEKIAPLAERFADLEGKMSSTSGA